MNVQENVQNVQNVLDVLDVLNVLNVSTVTLAQSQSTNPQVCEPETCIILSPSIEKYKKHDGQKIMMDKEKCTISFENVNSKISIKVIFTYTFISSVAYLN